MRIKSYFYLFFVLVFAFLLVFEIKSIAEIINKTDKCGNNTYYASVNNRSRFSEGGKSAVDIENNDMISDLCGCVKFTEITKTDNCLIARDGNRILEISLEYSAPMLYSYSCTVKEIRYTEEECVEKAKKLAASAVPNVICKGRLPEVHSFIKEGFTEKVLLYFPGNDEKIITVKLRLDTGNPVYYDARQLYDGAL